LKHLICVWHWCGSSLEWVYSLNYWPTLYLVCPSGSNQISGKTFKKLGWRKRQWHSKDSSYVHPQHMKVE
jgi:hypothetical protein